MTEQPDAAPPPSGRQPAAPTPQERVDSLRAQLLMAEAALPVPADRLRVRVKGVPWFQVGQHLIGSTWQEIHAGLLSSLQGAALDAGVELEVEGQK